MGVHTGVPPGAAPERSDTSTLSISTECTANAGSVYTPCARVVARIIRSDSGRGGTSASPRSTTA